MLFALFILGIGCDSSKHKETMRFPSTEEIKKLPSDGGSEFNRLIFEKSPYLLQHAANPVDWYPWGEEAFEKAKQEDKPIFLSVGYATCHWCHVMEHESFEDSLVATRLNEAFVCIKVDREERPDVDHVYMTVTQAMTGHGGWPMTIIMTWDKKPFFSGTYFPKESRQGRVGLLDLIVGIRDAWQNRREEVLASAGKITDFLKSYGETASAKTPDASLLDSAFTMMSGQFDHRHGGFGGAPKFPTPHQLTFLLRYWKRSGNADALSMVERTLASMRKGGIYDHIGLGFHRYSTDAQWFLPHFEKMLYDQAMLTIAYCEAYQATQNEFYKTTASEIIEYVLRDLTDAEGGFYSGEDADSEGEEGKFYLWSIDELKQVLGSADADLAQKIFGASAEGNYYEEATREYKGTNILHFIKDNDVLAGELGLTEADLQSSIGRIRSKLFDVRKQRLHPLKDDKILTDWNGLMIAALAIAARTLDRPEYALAADKAVGFIFSKLRNSDGRLLKRYRDGDAALPAHLDDYAFMTWGLLELYETTFDTKHLARAIELTDQTIKSFWDPTNGGFYFTAEDGEELIVRSKEYYDGAIPSGNSVAVGNLVRLNRLTGNTDYDKKADAAVRSFGESVSKVPMGYTQFMQAWDYVVGPSYEIVIAVKNTGDAKEILKKLNAAFVGSKVVLIKTDANAAELTRLAPFTDGQAAKDGKPTIYVCTNFSCAAPVFTADDMMKLLAK